MKKEILIPILLILVTAIVGVLISNLTKDKKEIRFNLSNPIPCYDEKIQLLEIYNTGDLVVNKISVVIPDTLVRYRIEKFSTLDTFKTSFSKNKSDFVFKNLTPQGSFRIVLTLFKERTLKSNDIEVYFDSGKSQPIFQQENTFSWTTFVMFLFFCFYLLMMGYSFIQILGNSLEHKVYYDPYNEILLKKKPFYLSGNKWDGLRNDAIKYLFKKDYGEPYNRFSFRILSLPKPNMITGNEWMTIIDSANDKFKDDIRDYINHTFPFLSESLFSFSKPDNLKIENWNEIVELISNTFVLYSYNKLIDNIDVTKYFYEFKKTKKPDIVKSKRWQQVEEMTERIFLITFFDDNLFKANNMNFNKLSEYSFTHYNSKRLIELGIKIENIKNDEKKYKYLILYLNRILNNLDLPAEMDESIKEEMKNLKELENEILVTRNKIANDLQEAKEIKKEFIPLKEKVLKQLDIINLVINGSDILDRIENYEGIFSPGNLQNLNKIRNLMK